MKLCYTYIPTHNRRKRIPKPEKIAATNDTRSSLNMSLVNFVLVTSYTKNHAVKNIPIPRRMTVRWGNTAGFTGETYLDIDSSSIYKRKVPFDIMTTTDSHFFLIN